MPVLTTINSRSWVVAGAILVVVVGGASLLLIIRASGSRARQGGEHERAAGSSNELATSRHEALTAIKNGRFDRAFGFYRALPTGAWEAGDCLQLGETLIEKDRVVLGWAALEAARRIDPKHAASALALDALQGKLALATGRERGVLHEAASRGELLRKIPNGPALGLFVLGLAQYSKNADDEDEFLDRLNSHHQAALHRVDTIASALKLTARLFMETGRVTEAAQLLDPLVASRATDGGAIGSDSLDREAAWLLSRAALQSDQDERADAMLALAGDFGTKQAALPEPSAFVGSRRCGECHPRLYREQQGASRHAQTLRFGDGLKDAPLPGAPVPDPVIKGISHSFARKSDNRIEVESRIEDRVFRAVVEYAVGSGRHGITMLAKDEEGIERELRISYFGQDEGWGLTKGLDFAPRNGGDHIGMGLGRKGLNHCLSCHTTWFRSVNASQSSVRRPEALDRGIGCERCHGPGLSHVKAAGSGFAELAIALTTTTPSRDRLNSCVECHAADGTIPPSDPEFTRAQGTTFLFSRCFTASKDRFGCTTCHDPHRSVNTDTAQYEAKCLGCHSGKPTKQSAPLAEKGRGQIAGEGQACPVNPKGSCISCHMPKVEDPTRRSRFTDHHIRVHRDLARAH
jgi:hypothetical protein